MHWFTSRFVPHNDLHVSESYRRFGGKPALSWAENCSGSFTSNPPSPSSYFFLNKAETFCCGLTSLCYYFWPLSLFPGCWSQNLLFWRSNTKMYDPFVLHLSYGITLIFISVLNSYYCRGTRVNPMHHFKPQRRACKWSQIMIPMVMRNLSSVKSLYINSYIPLSSYLEQSLIQLLTFVYGPLGMSL